MRTTNPVFNDRLLTPGQVSSESMTVNGTIQKTFLALFLLVFSGGWMWAKVVSGTVPGFIMIFALAAFIVGLVISFKPTTAPMLVPVYAVLEGLLIGGISAIFEMRYPGLVMQAVSLTCGVLFCLLVAYRSGMIRATAKFKIGVIAATGAIALIYLVSFILSLFHVNMPLIHGSSGLGIAFSVVVTAVAALNLILDFDFIENAAAAGAPKYMEWYGAFGLLVTLIWLYIEILKLLAKLRDRR